MSVAPQWPHTHTHFNRIRSGLITYIPTILSKTDPSLIIGGRIKTRKGKESRQKTWIWKNNHCFQGQVATSPGIRTHMTHDSTWTHTHARVSSSKSTKAVRFIELLPGRTLHHVQVWFHWKLIKVCCVMSRNSFQSLKSSGGMVALSHSCQETTRQAEWDTEKMSKCVTLTSWCFLIHFQSTQMYIYLFFFLVNCCCY